jgi:hypothetical protein
MVRAGFRMLLGGEEDIEVVAEASNGPVLDGQLTQLERLRGLGLETRLERRPTVIAEADGATLRFEGKRLTFPEHVTPDLEFLVTTDAPFTVRDLPGTLNKQGRYVLVRRLVREGFLRIL